MNIYVEKDYRIILRKALEERRKLDVDATFQGMAAFMRIQKSYLSKVLHGHAELSSDQMHLACQYLEFSEEQLGYMMLLLEYARSGLHDRKEKLGAEIGRIQKKYLETKEHIAARTVGGAGGLAEYYLDPLYQIVHICLSIERYAHDLGLLARDLEVRPARVASAVNKLEQLGIIARAPDRGIRVLMRNVHLPREAAVYPAWRNQLKVLSMQRLQSMSNDYSYSFAVVFSADEETRKKIQSRFLELLKEIEPFVKAAPAEDTFAMSFDLFSWTKG